ncbi:Probable cytosolic iron-sulfur protein assembly protein, CIAO1/Cia1 like protein [Aduncisulcus paluster]|uniref:Probable cytosolic iron-sulfur protein assembly protein, CIAO1/Cia1 like protein n=1 Tax=Aduncisulcus paluster TaxID=2918883 RepID=A0ABQ5K3A7_9EUKA|nr:Probable cytosolic iron-sulfur protein assembly protein, CIAO1/Cia1 like protein [Aduncisulcus paluster]
MKVKTIKAHSDRVWDVSFSSDGLFLASCGADGSVNIFRKNVIRTLGKEPNIEYQHHQHISYSPSGEDHYISAEQLKHIKSVRTIRSVCFSDCGRYLVTGSFDGAIRIYLLINGFFYLLSVLRGHSSEVKCVCFGGGYEYIASSGRDKTVWIWHIESELAKEEEKILRDMVTGSDTTTIHFTTSSKDSPISKSSSSNSTGETADSVIEESVENVIEVGPDATVKGYEIKQIYDCDEVLACFIQDVKSVSFHPHFPRLLASSSYDNTVLVHLRSLEGDWEQLDIIESSINPAGYQKRENSMVAPYEHTHTVWSVKWLDSPVVVRNSSVGASDGSAAVLSSSPGPLMGSSLLPTLPNHTSLPGSLCPTFATFCSDGCVRVWRLELTSMACEHVCVCCVDEGEDRIVYGGTWVECCSCSFEHPSSMKYVRTKDEAEEEGGEIEEGEEEELCSVLSSSCEFPGHLSTITANALGKLQTKGEEDADHESCVNCHSQGVLLTCGSDGTIRGYAVDGMHCRTLTKLEWKDRQDKLTSSAQSDSTLIKESEHDEAKPLDVTPTPTIPSCPCGCGMSIPVPRNPSISLSPIFSIPLFRCEINSVSSCCGMPGRVMDPQAREDEKERKRVINEDYFCPSIMCAAAGDDGDIKIWEMML